MHQSWAQPYRELTSGGRGAYTEAATTDEEGLTADYRELDSSLGVMAEPRGKTGRTGGRLAFLEQKARVRECQAPAGKVRGSWIRPLGKALKARLGRFKFDVTGDKESGEPLLVKEVNERGPQ